MGPPGRYRCMFGVWHRYETPCTCMPLGTVGDTSSVRRPVNSRGQGKIHRPKGVVAGTAPNWHGPRPTPSHRERRPELYGEPS
jgi:hypothetical protein